jgi:hypothetical protein
VSERTFRRWTRRCEEEGTASTYRALKEVFGKHGLPMSLYTDRGAHYFNTPKAGGEIDRGRPTQVGRALEQLGVEHIGAYSPQARGRSERTFRTLQNRLVKELALASITGIEAANAFIREVYLPAHNARFAVDPAGEGSAFTPIPGVDLDEILVSRRSSRSAMTIASPTARSSCRSRRAQCGRISSRRGSRSTSMPTAPTPSSTDRAASAATMRTEQSEMRNSAPKSARGQTLWTAWACPPRPQENKSRRSRHSTC